MDKTFSIEYQYGYLIGEYIVLKYLPTLSNDVFRTRNFIQISEEDENEYKRLSDLWYNKYNTNKEQSNEEWNNYTLFRRQLEQKYLPHELICRVPLIDVENIKELKRGISSSLWGCDVCSYKIEKDEDIQITHDERFYLTTIKFELDNK